MPANRSSINSNRDSSPMEMCSSTCTAGAGMTGWGRRRHAGEWDESDGIPPSDPKLHETLALPATSDNAVILSHAQQVISGHTGISVISDYFTAEWIGPSPNQPG